MKYSQGNSYALKQQQVGIVISTVRWRQPKSDQTCIQVNMLAVFPLITARDK